jgi:hypothetical protein
MTCSIVWASNFEKNFSLYNTPKKNIYLVYTIYNNKLLYIIYPIYIKKKGNFVFFWFGWLKRCPTDGRRLKEKKKFREKEKKVWLGLWYVLFTLFLALWRVFALSVVFLLVTVLFVALCRCFLFFERWQKTMFYFFWCRKEITETFRKRYTCFGVVLLLRRLTIWIFLFFADSGVHISFLSSKYYNPIIHTPYRFFMSENNWYSFYR